MTHEAHRLRRFVSIPSIATMSLFRLTAPAFASALTFVAAFATTTPALAVPPTGRFAMVHHLPVDGVAEIITAGDVSLGKPD